ncbi:unnamed protein product [Tilletia controversa]|uniref:Amino acid permease/ SLC12A domain-containing protein n=3 Tax=Tilletia TaxID=13289 RepID=A0A8X7MS13_9BASI|nr:hypothetical protein CF336_g4193 [Tilletia laevis]KAE8197340.1 hypothetical protein CF328_g3880 [Tilletia controversa]KAE8261159.1 hypothetical protein A4X03_0g3492 [Tilletia caries]KAE8205193.1 hypothetical protein CF335_g2388 [Tilletia laevis]KAE8247280.1 hypothetical protein A4X06_0g4571 [Tilletia controversa]
MSSSPDEKAGPPGYNKDDDHRSSPKETTIIDEVAYGEERNAFGQRSNEKLKPALNNRHLAMISIGGVIGTGLFLGTASSLARGGPVGLWLGYILMGSICYAMMMCLGEMISYLPIPGGHIALASRFVDPALGFAMGWNYFYNWAIVLPAELAAAATLIGFWSDLSPAIWISLCLIIVIVINFLGARAYGETEFWFCSIKVITIVGLIILSFLLDVGAVGERRGFQYWKNPGPFVQYLGIEGSWGRFLGFWSVLINAGFSFIGTEIVAMAAAEAKNPRKALPKAINKVWVRILVFYVLGTLAVGVIVPSNNDQLLKGTQANKSAFVIAIRAAGIKSLPSIINAALVTSAASAASSDLYTSSRALYSLALAGQAPRIFAKTLKNGLPLGALIVSASFSGLAYLSVASGPGKVFEYLQGLSSICGLVSWWVISLTYLRFHKGLKTQGIVRDHKTFPFVSPLQPYLGWWTLIWTSIVMLFCGFKNFINGYFDTASFVTSYLPLPLFFVIWVGYKLWHKTKVVKAEEMDFYTGLKEILDEEVEEAPPRNLWEKFWAWI